MALSSSRSPVESRTHMSPRAVARTGAVGLACAAMVVTGVQMASGAAPQQVLQAVDVTIDHDGAVSAIDSTAIRQNGDGSTEDDEKTHSPTKVADDLPVRVLTSYRLGKKSGTDLRDIEGEKGRVYIDVTVQNITVRPQVLSYDSEGENKSAPALVGTPLTVVASANLGDSALSDVVVGEPGTEDRVTNGVVSRDDKDQARVQWAALLAPPRLAPSATFTLVQNTEDFKAPTFDVSVQPGLVTDMSVANLVDAAFDSDNGTRALTSRTIALLSSVGSVLTDATTVLAKVEEQLDGSASDLGTKTIADLQSSSSFVTSALNGLGSDLDSLDSEITSSLNSSSTDAVVQLGASFQQVKDKVLGDEDSYQPGDPVQTQGCAVTAPQGSKQTTVYGQLLDVQAQLKQLSDSTAGCRTQVVSALRNTIGQDTDSCATAADPTPSALGSLNCAAISISTTSDDLNQLKIDVTQTFDAELLANTTESYDQVIPALDDAHTAALRLRDGAFGGDDFDELKSELEDLRDQLTAVDTGLDTINGRASDQVDLLSGSGGALQQAAELAVVLCDQLPDSADSNEASVLLSGQTCDGTVAQAPGYDSSLIEKITETSDAWATTRDETAATGSLGSMVGGSDGLLDQVNDLLDRLQALVDAGNAASLQAGVRRLANDLDLIYQERPQPDDAEGMPVAPKPSFVDTLKSGFAAFRANQTNVNNKLATGFDKATRDLDLQSLDVGKSSASLSAARDAADNQAGGFFDTFAGSLNGVGQAIVANGGEAIDRQKKALDTEESDFAKNLRGTVKKALDRIGKQVDSANADLSSSQTDLVADLKAILVNIGTPEKNGSGLLGTVYTGARRTGASTTKIGDATDLSTAFSRVRGASLDDLYLQQAQVAASLSAEADFPAFDLSLPDGSTSRTVFSFHIGKD